MVRRKLYGPSRSSVVRCVQFINNVPYPKQLIYRQLYPEIQVVRSTKQCVLRRTIRPASGTVSQAVRSPSLNLGRKWYGLANSAFSVSKIRPQVVRSRKQCVLRLCFPSLLYPCVHLRLSPIPLLYQTHEQRIDTFVHEF